MCIFNLHVVSKCFLSLNWHVVVPRSNSGRCWGFVHYYEVSCLFTYNNLNWVTDLCRIVHEVHVFNCRSCWFVHIQKWLRNVRFSSEEFISFQFFFFFFFVFHEFQKYCDGVFEVKPCVLWQISRKYKVMIMCCKPAELLFVYFLCAKRWSVKQAENLGNVPPLTLCSTAAPPRSGQGLRSVDSYRRRGFENETVWLSVNVL